MTTGWAYLWYESLVSPFPSLQIVVKTTQNISVPFVLFLLRLYKLKRRQHAKKIQSGKLPTSVTTPDSFLSGRSLVWIDTSAPAFHTQKTKWQTTAHHRHQRTQTGNVSRNRKETYGYCLEAVLMGPTNSSRSTFISFDEQMKTKSQWLPSLTAGHTGIQVTSPPVSPCCFINSFNRTHRVKTCHSAVV